MEIPRIDLNNSNLSDGLAQDISKWRNEIHVTNLNIAEARL